MNKALLELSGRLRREADSLLRRTRLLALLEKYGRVSLTGSYELGLMVDGDIDILVINGEVTRERVWQCLRELMMAGSFRGYLFYDFIKHRRPGFPRGYYIGLKTKQGGRKWKVDIWFVSSRSARRDSFMKKLAAALDEKKRGRILKIKSEAKKRGLDLPSYAVYQAVMNGGAASLKDVQAHAAKKE